MAQRASDQITVVDLTDGVSVNFEKYAHIFDGNTVGALAGSTTCKVSAMAGPTAVACSVDLAAITAPTGITVTKDGNTMSPTLTITASTSFKAPGFLVVPVQVGAVTIVQSIALSFAKTGATGSAGVSSTITGLKNEAQMIPTDSSGKTTSAATISVDFYGYVGSSRAAVTATPGALPTGISVGTNTPGTTSADGVLTLNVANASTLGGASTGHIQIGLKCNGITRPAIFAWAKAPAGADGADALTLEINSSNGLVFKNTQVSTTLTAKVFKGGVEQSSAQISALGTIKWYKDGVFTSKTGTSLTVAPGDVSDSATYEARLEN